MKYYMWWRKKPAGHDTLAYVEEVGDVGTNLGAASSAHFFMHGGWRSSRAFSVPPTGSRWDIASPHPSPPGGDQLATHVEQRVDAPQLPLRHYPDSSPQTIDPPSMESANGMKICRPSKLMCRCRLSPSLRWSLFPLVRPLSRPP